MNLEQYLVALESDQDIALEYDIDDTENDMIYEPEERDEDDALVPRGTSALAFVPRGTSALALVPRGTSTLVKVGGDSDTASNIKKGAVAAAILAAAGTATVGVVKVVKTKKAKAAGYSGNAKKSRALYADWKEENGDVINKEIALRKSDIAKAQRVISGYFSKYGKSLGLAAAKDALSGSNAVIEVEPNFMNNSWMTGDATSMNAKFTDFINPNFQDLWDIGVSPVMPISRICGLIINPIGKPKKNVEVTREEAAEVSKFKSKAKAMCQEIKQAIDKLDLTCVSVKIEDYPGGGFACGVELKASPEFADTMRRKIFK